MKNFPSVFVLHAPLVNRSAHAIQARTFALHLLASAAALTLVLGTFHLGWYRWPGWYLVGVLPVVMVLTGVELALGPLLTLLIASRSKPRPELMRDITIIVVVQLSALSYGALSLWHGRPLYHAFSENLLQLVQAYDIEPAHDRDPERRVRTVSYRAHR